MSAFSQDDDENDPEFWKFYTKSKLTKERALQTWREQKHGPAAPTPDQQIEASPEMLGTDEQSVQEYDTLYKQRGSLNPFTAAPSFTEEDKQKIAADPWMAERHKNLSAVDAGVQSGIDKNIAGLGQFGTLMGGVLGLGSARATGAGVGRASVHSAAQAASPVPIPAPSNPALPKPQLAGPAAKLVRSGERGAAIDIVGEVVGAVKDTAAAVDKKFRVAPGLEKLEMPSPVAGKTAGTAEDAYVTAKTRMGNAGDIHASRARSIRGKPGEEFLESEFLKVLDMRDKAQRGLEQIRRGDPVLLEGGITVHDAMTEALDAEQRLLSMPGGQQFMNDRMLKVDSWRQEIETMARGSNQMGGAPRQDYIPHILKAKINDKNVPNVVADSASKGAIARWSAGEDMARPILSEHSDALVRQRAEKFAEGSTKELLGDPLDRLAVKAASVERRSRMNKFVKDMETAFGLDKNQFKTNPAAFDETKHAIRWYGNGSDDWMVLPKEVNEAIAKIGLNAEPGVTEQALGWVSNLAKKGLLKYNPKFQIKQLADDPATGFMNAPVGRKLEFLKSAWGHFTTAFEELGKEQRGEYSPILTAMRRRGTMNEVFESLLDTVDDVTTISEKTKVQKPGALGKLSNFLDRLGQSREAGVKSGLADVWEQEGALPDRAVRWSNYVTGDYQNRSAAGREMDVLVPMKKWFITQIGRLTKEIATDPVTGKASKKGLLSSPAAMIVPAAVLSSAWNAFWTNGKMMKPYAFAVPGTDYAVTLPGFGGFVRDIGDGVSNPADMVADGVNPGIKQVVIAGKRMIDPKRSYTARDAANAVENFAAPVRDAEQILSKKKGEKSGIVDALQLISPVQIFNWKKSNKFEKKEGSVWTGK